MYVLLDKIVAKGKGELQTWWVDLASTRSKASSDTDSQSQLSSSDLDSQSFLSLEGEQPEEIVVPARTKRLIDWNVDVLLRLLRYIEAGRKASPRKDSESERPDESILMPEAGKTCFDEVKEVITLPKHAVHSDDISPEDVELDQAVAEQLYDFVRNIAMMYRDNSFHNFEHGESF